MFCFGSRAQGAIEYLLVLGAVVLVVSIVVGSVTSVVGSGKVVVNDSSDAISSDGLKDILASSLPKPVLSAIPNSGGGVDLSWPQKSGVSDYDVWRASILAKIADVVCAASTCVYSDDNPVVGLHEYVVTENGKDPTVDPNNIYVSASRVTVYNCSDGVISAPEVCDGANLGGQTCVSKGYLRGNLTCNFDCMDYNTSACNNNQNIPPVASFAKSPFVGTGVNSDGAGSVTVDSSGNIYLEGYFSSNISFGNDVNLINRGSYDFFVVKYNSSGVAQWARGPASGTGASADYARFIFVDSSGNVYLSGNFRSASLGFGNNITLTNKGVLSGGEYPDDFFVVKYDSSGNPLWARGATSGTGASSDLGTAIFVDASGNVYLTGNFYSPTLGFGPGVSLTNPVTNGGDFYIVKYDSSGTALWVKSFTNVTGALDVLPQAIFVDASNNIYLAGYFSYPSLEFGPGVSLTKNASYDFFVVKYDSSGVAQWARGATSGTGASADYARSIFVDASGNVYVSGDFTSANLGFGNNINLTINGVADYWGYPNDFFVVKYDSSGVAQWARGAISGTGTGADYGYSVYADVSGNVYLAGQSGSSVLGFSNDINLTSRGSDFFVVKYDSSGVAQWAKGPISTPYSRSSTASSIFVDTSNNIYLGGNFSASSFVSLGFGNDVNLIPRGPFGYSDFFLVKYVPQ